jgi:predicted permease
MVMHTEVPGTMIFSRVFMIFSMTFFGVLARQLDLIKKEASLSFSNLIIYITIPCLIFTAISSGVKWERLMDGIWAPMLSIVITSIICGVASIYCRVKKVPAERIGTFITLCMLPNSGFIGFPIVFSILGKEGLAFAVLYDLGTNLVIWTVAVALLGGGSFNKPTLKNLINPVIVAILCGLIINRFAITFPEILTKPLELVGNVTVPLAMIIIGFTLAGLSFHMRMIDHQLIAVCLIKLIMYPLVAFGVIHFLHLSPVVGLTIIIQATMPCMASTTALTQKFGGDPQFSTTAILVSSVLCIGTSPLMILLLAR